MINRPILELLGWRNTTTDPMNLNASEAASSFEDVHQLKNRLFTTFPNELRTPLSLVIGPLDELIKNARDEEQLALLKLAKRGTGQLAALVDTISELSQVDQTSQQLNATYFHISNFLRPIAAEFSSMSEVRSIPFHLHQTAGDSFIKADQDKLRYAIVNLLRYCFDRARQGEHVSLHSSVVNLNGVDHFRAQIIIGTDSIIAESTLMHSSEPMSLPVQLTSVLVKLHHGSLLIDAGGMAYRIDIPTRTTSAPSAVVTNSGFQVTEAFINNKSGKHNAANLETILIVEDNGELREYMASIFSSDFNVTTAANGVDGFHLATTVIPSLIITDMMMPKLDGAALLEKLKADERTSHIPVVVLTAKTQADAKLDGYRLGADDYIAKPFSVDELTVRVINLIEQRKQLADRFRERILVEPSPTNLLSLDEKFVLKVRDIVERNIGNFNLSVEMVADEMALSRTQLLRKLKALTGQSPNDFIRNMRLKRAADMITNRVDTITQVGYAVGFNDQSYFTKSFKRHFGMTPSDYAAQHSSIERVEKI